MKTVIITGASSGIGQETALLFAKKGFHVIACVRTLNCHPEQHHHPERHCHPEERSDEGSPWINLEYHPLDVTDDDSIKDLQTKLINENKKIDILINNAGSGYLGTLEQTSLMQAKEVMDVNFFGVWRMTQMILPFMRKQRSGRIISITSMGGVIGQPFNDAYCAAKFAIEGMMESLASVVQQFGIQISLVEPGPVNTQFVDSVKKRSQQLAFHLEEDYKEMLDAYFRYTKTSFAEHGQSPAEIADIIFEIAQSTQSQFRYQTSELTRKIAKMKLADPTGNQTIHLSSSKLFPTIPVA